MQRRSSRVAFAALLFIVSVAWGGCSSNSSDGNGADGGASNDATADDGGAPSFDSARANATSLAITPADGTLDVTDLAALPSQQLTARVTYDDGSTATALGVTWSVDRLDIATIASGGGTVTASGSAFGKTTITAKAQGLTATTSLTVRLHVTQNLAGLAAADVAKLAAATAVDPAVGAIVYPYDKTVFPRGLLAPEIMWNGGSDGDVYMLHVTAQSYDLAIVTAADPPSRYAIPSATWNALTTTAAGGDATLELRRLSAGAAYASARETWHVADANLRGTIYYWAIDQGQIIRIDLPSGTRSPVFDTGSPTALGTPAPLNAQSPNSPPWEDNGGGKRCVACHSVSKDGSTVASIFSRAGSEGPAGFYGIRTQTVGAIADYTQNGIFVALTPDGKLAVMNTEEKWMQLLDTATGAAVPSALDGMRDLCDPAFSPDGKTFALAAQCDPGLPPPSYPVEFRTSNLVLYDFDQGTKAFTNARTVITSSGVGDAIAFPTFSPDSSLVFFQRGDFSRAKVGTTQHGNDDLFVARAKAASTPIALDAANGKGVLTGDNLHLNYAPTVNPIVEGGYIWIVFTSPRDYGNRMVSPRKAPPQDATWANQKQLWVTAVDATLGTVDPSHPAFWLPGQDATSANMFGYWALAPCKPTGTGTPASCTAGFECCSGFCRSSDDAGAGAVCIDQGSGCHQEGEKCSARGDCCTTSANVDCVAGICQKTSPK
jgi:hypothetical protein